MTTINRFYTSAFVLLSLIFFAALPVSAQVRKNPGPQEYV